VSSRTINQISMSKHFVKSPCIHEYVIYLKREIKRINMYFNVYSFFFYCVNEHINKTLFFFTFPKLLRLHFFFKDFFDILFTK